jgi:glutamine synthetase
VSVCEEPADAATRLRTGSVIIHLYMASQITAGLAGVEERVDAGEFDAQPYRSGWPVPPASLIEAIGEPGADPLYRRQSGEEFSDSVRAMRWSEWSRSLAHVTGWERREHFEVF